MVNILIATSDIKMIKRLTNEILSDNYNVKIVEISTNENETIRILNNSNIDIAFIDVKIIENSVNRMLEKISNCKKEKYRDSIIIISDIIRSIRDIPKNDMIAGYILEKSTKNEIIYKVNEAIADKDTELTRRAIIRELECIRYNLEYKGTNYLIDTILQVYKNRKLMLINSLQNDVYPIISNLYKKSINTIRCNIRYATDCMYCECDIKKLNEYFGLVDDEKPTTKDVIYTVLNKIG